MRPLRLANAEFFDVHRIPFLFGSPWTAADELSDPYQTVLTRTLNETLFAGENSVGQSLQIGNNHDKIVGVMDDFKPMPLYLETDGGAFNTIKSALVPFSLTPALELRKSNGSTRCQEDPAEDTFASFLETDCYWLHHWVELDSSNDAAKFKQYFDDYAIEQRQFGRFMGPSKPEGPIAGSNIYYDIAGTPIEIIGVVSDIATDWIASDRLSLADTRYNVMPILT